MTDLSNFTLITYAISSIMLPMSFYVYRIIDYDPRKLL